MKIIEARFIEDLSMEDYLELPGWSRSSLLNVITGNGGPKKATGDWGTSLHVACELAGGDPPEPIPGDMPDTWAEQIRSMPEGWTDRVVAMPKGIRGKAKEAFLAEAAGKVCVPEGEYSKICAAFRSMWNSEYMGPILRDPTIRREVTMVGIDEATGLAVKSRPDIAQGSLLIDVKSTKDPEEAAFEREMATYGYEMQAALALALWKAITGEDASYALGPVGKEHPHRAPVYEVGDEWLAIGHERVRVALDIVAALGLKRSSTNTPLYWTAEPRVLNSPPPWERDKLVRVQQFARALQAQQRKAVG
jgi:hypothetical protein